MGILLPRRRDDGRELTNAQGHPVYPELTCPAGHVMTWEWNLIGDAFPLCTHDWQLRKECGLRLWVCPMTRREKPGSPRFIVAEVDWRDIAYITQHYMDPDEIIGWLHLAWMPNPPNAKLVQLRIVN